MSKVLRFDASPSRVNTRVLRITGSADASVDTLEWGVDLSSLAVAQMAGGRFSVILELQAGRNQFVFVPISATGTPLQSETLVINYDQATEQLHQVPNTLDFHGTQLGYERLPGERNVSFKKRLLQGGRARALERNSPPMKVATEIGFPFSEEMVRFTVTRSQFNSPRTNAAYLSVTTTRLKYSSDRHLESEGPIVFDAGYPYYTPQNEVSPFGSVTLLTEGGERVSDRAFEYLPETNRILLMDRELIGTDLMLVYHSVESIDLAGLTLATLKTAVETDGYITMEITPTEFHDDSTAAEWLVPFEWRLIDPSEDHPAGGDQPGVKVHVSQVRAFPLHQHRLEYLVSGSGLGTKLEKYVQEINQVDHRTWKQVVVGEDGLRDREINPLYDSLPHLTSPVRGFWGNNLNIHEAIWMGGLDQFEYRGVPSNAWQSGTGQLGDMESDTFVQQLASHTDVVDEVPTETNILYGIL